MIKINKIKLLLLIFILIISILGGCSKTPKAPEGFDKDLWEDSVEIIRIIHKTYENDNNFSVEDEDKIEEYFDVYQGRTYDNTDEHKMIRIAQDLYKDYKGYLFMKMTFGEDGRQTKRDKETVVQLFQELQDKYDNLIK